MCQTRRSAHSIHPKGPAHCRGVGRYKVLAPDPFPAPLSVPRVVSAQALVACRGNRYSVRPNLHGPALTVTFRLDCTHLDIATAATITSRAAAVALRQSTLDKLLRPRAPIREPGLELHRPRNASPPIIPSLAKLTGNHESSFTMRIAGTVRIRETGRGYGTNVQAAEFYPGPAHPMWQLSCERATQARHAMLFG